MEASNALQLYKLFAPILKLQTRKLYLRSTSTSEWRQQQAAAGTSIASKESEHPHLALPLYSQYLIIAAFLASYNASSSDTQLFSKQDSKRRKGGGLKKPRSEVIHLADNIMGLGSVKR